jgi:hypothetical protein
MYFISQHKNHFINEENISSKIFLLSIYNTIYNTLFYNKNITKTKNQPKFYENHFNF